MGDIATELKTLEKFSGWPGEPGWMKNLRTQARLAYTTTEWPGRKDEEWRRTSIDLFDLEKRSVPAAGKSQPKAVAVREGFSGHLAFENGVLVERSINPELEKAGVVLSCLQDPEVKGVQAALEGDLRLSDAKVVPLHFAALEFGATFQVPANVVAEKPFLIEVRESRKGVLTSPHFIIEAGRLSQATLVIRSTSPEGVSFTSNSGTSLRLDDAAVFKLIEVQNYGIGATVLDHSVGHIARDAQLFHWNACLGSSVAKTRFQFFLEGEGAGLRTHGVYFGVEDQHKDIRIVLNHEAPRATSYALYKGAVRDRSRTIFQGLIEVMPGANKTDAYLSNKNLILNDGARADSLPQLKIDTNDVKCSHGSTTGKVNEDQVFYLISRGFSPAEARLMIAQGMFAELIAEAPEFLRDELEAEVVKALGGAVVTA